MLVDDRAVALEIFVHNNAWPKAAEQPCQGTLAFLKACATQVLAVQLDHVKGA